MAVLLLTGCESPRNSLNCPTDCVVKNMRQYLMLTETPKAETDERLIALALPDHLSSIYKHDLLPQFFAVPQNMTLSLENSLGSSFLLARVP
jgi:hypothetical protein